MSLLNGLTTAQREAVTHKEGPLLILAGPGSGKTRVVTHRIAYLVEQGVRPRRILALTFTNKAAEEMQNRVRKLAHEHGMHVSTFHSFCVRILREHGHYLGLENNFTIFDRTDQLSAVKQLLNTLASLPPGLKPNGVLAAISRAKNEMVSPSDFAERYANANYRSNWEKQEVIAAIYESYQSYLMRQNAADFDDLLLHTVRLFQEQPNLRAALDEWYEYVMVDEYQDTNRAQYRIARALAIDVPNLAVTGDPDQSIYGWRGADIGNILSFEKDFKEKNVKVVKLEQNYRSTKKILALADMLIQNNQQRKHKQLFTENEEGADVTYLQHPNPDQEAQFLAERIAYEVSEGKGSYGDYAIFYRVNALSRAFETAFTRHGIPYQLVGAVEFFQRREVKDLMAYLQVIVNPHSDISLLRVINVPARQIGKTTVERLVAKAQQHAMPLVEVLRRVETVETLSNAAQKRVKKFFDNVLSPILELRNASVAEALQEVLERTHYATQFDAASEEGLQRLANVDELQATADSFDKMREDDPELAEAMGLAERPALEQFLEQSALKSETDNWDDDAGVVTLMTLHASKGLEFPNVFIAGFEENLVPHRRAIESYDNAEMEEERRLAFVGITRAEKRLFLCRAGRRYSGAMPGMTIPSSFLNELPYHQLNHEKFTETDEHWYPAGKEGSSYIEELYGESDDAFEDDEYSQIDEYEDVDPLAAAENFDEAASFDPATFDPKLMTADKLAEKAREE